MTSQPILLQGGTVLEHGVDDAVSTRVADILVEDGVITKVETSIQPSPHCKVLDCKEKIISPGFIDTHRHMWQTQLKGRHADQLFMPYMLTGGMINSLYSPSDTELGVLTGGLESIDAGTTAVVDHAHVIRSREHMDAVLNGHKGSGIRAIYCPAIAAYPSQWEPTIKLDSQLADWFLPQWDATAASVAETGGRVRLGLAFDGHYLPKETIKNIFDHVRKHQTPAHVITSHYSPISNPVALFKQHGLLGPDLLISHPNELENDTIETVQSHAIHCAYTPSSELQMGLGRCAALSDELRPFASLGVDCHSATNASIVEEARLLLQWARATNAVKHIEAGDFYGHNDIRYTVEQVFNLATIQGARAVRLEKEVGSIAVGKKADLVVWDGTSPAMMCAAQHNPVAAIMLHSSTRDVEAVLVDGVVRKADGKLLPVEVGGQTKTWPSLVEELKASYQALQKEIDRIGVANKGQELGAAFAAVY